MEKIIGSKKLTVIIAAASALLVVLVIFVVVKINSAGLESTLQQTKSFDIDKSLAQKSISEVDGLLELPDKDKAIVVEIKEKDEFIALSPIFERAYEGDLIIFLPTQTIIYDPLTKTIRDISSESFYEQVTK